MFHFERTLELSRTRLRQSSGCELRQCSMCVCTLAGQGMRLLPSAIHTLLAVCQYTELLPSETSLLEAGPPPLTLSGEGVYVEF